MKVVFRIDGCHGRFLHPEDNVLFDNFSRKLKRHFYEKANGLIQKERFWYFPLARRALYRHVVVDSFGRAKEYQDTLIFEVCVVSRLFRCMLVITKYILKRRSGSGNDLYMPIQLDSMFGAPFEPYTLKELFARHSAREMVGYVPWVYRGTGYHDREYGPTEWHMVTPCNRRQLADIKNKIKEGDYE